MKRIILILTLILGVLPVVRAAEAVLAPPVREAYVMHFDGDWRIAGGLPEKALLIGLQGLANRSLPRLYIVHADGFPWEITGPLQDFYERKHGVHFTELKTTEEALGRFAQYAKGYVVWDPAVMTTMNAY